MNNNVLDNTYDGFDQEIIESVKKGTPVIIPTDTVYGIGCNPYNDESVQKIFALKKRPKNKSIPLLVDTIKTAESIGDFSKYCKDFLQQHWPGALTVLVQKKKGCSISKYVSNDDSVAIRIPNQKELLKFIEKVGGVLAVTSANISGKQPLSTFNELKNVFHNEIPIIFNGEKKGCIPSTIIDCTGNSLRVVRQGTVYIK